MHPSVVSVYAGVLKESAEVCLDADEGVTTAASSYAKESREAADALETLDGPYRVGRSTAAAFVPGVKLSDTLKAQHTDTDKVSAIEGLMEVLDDHAGSPWSDELTQGELGKKAGETIQEINESIEASKALSEAHTARGAAYDRYLLFKRVVRDALGSASKQYKRIHLRDSNSTTEEGGTTGDVALEVVAGFAEQGLHGLAAVVADDAEVVAEDAHEVARLLLVERDRLQGAVAVLHPSGTVFEEQRQVSRV